jgi:diguanylate cyclase (GGDEF)-like protein
MRDTTPVRAGFWQIVALDAGIVLALAAMTTGGDAIDLFHAVFLLLVVEAFLVNGWGFWIRLVLALGVTQLLIVRAGEPAWQDLAEPMVLATIAVLVFLMHGSRERIRQALRLQATLDPLTGLLNRRALQAQLDSEVRRLKNDQSPFAVVYIDLDAFKNVNDEHGHDIGDMVLTEAARRIEGVTRDVDRAGRIGGDEFALLLGSSVTRSDAEAVARRLVETLERPFTVGGQSVALSASMGIALAAVGRTPQQLLADADRAMYTVKRERKGTYGFAT